MQLFREFEDVEELLVDWTSISSMSTSDEDDPPQPESSVEEDIWKLIVVIDCFRYFIPIIS